MAAPQLAQEPELSISLLTASTAMSELLCIRKFVEDGLFLHVGAAARDRVRLAGNTRGFA